MASTEQRGVFDVAVVGFGPSGAVAAGLLAKQGLSVFVCDRLREVYDKPRAIAIDHEVMRVLQQLGVVDAVEAYVEPFTPSAYYGVDGQLIKRLTMVAPPYPLGYTPSNVFTQPPVEEVLRAHVREAERTQVVLGAELTALTQDADGATARGAASAFLVFIASLTAVAAAQIAADPNAPAANAPPCFQRPTACR